MKTGIEYQMANSYEVELKFRIESANSMAALLQQKGAVPRTVVLHVDRYFNHPCRDFRSTDEAFRIRSVGDKNWATYKGAVIGNVAKTRHEVEVGLADGSDSALRYDEMVRLLGFRFVREVRKSRQAFSLQFNGDQFELALDEVPGLGSFLEIELLAEDHRRETAEAAVWHVAHSLDLLVTEPRSYLDLLLEDDGASR